MSKSKRKRPKRQIVIALETLVDPDGNVDVLGSMIHNLKKIGITPLEVHVITHKKPRRKR